MFCTEVTTTSHDLTLVESAAPLVPRCKLPESLAACAVVRPAEANSPTVLNALRRYGPRYIEQHGWQINADQARVLSTLLNCRQPGMGAHAWRCRWCGHRHLSYNGCGNRHCPECGGSRRSEWLHRVVGWSLPTTYLHLVLTLPHELEPLLLANRAELYGLLFRAANQALSEITHEVYQAQPGWVMLLHTWGQEGLLHVHLHVIQTAGGLSEDGTAWVEMHPDDEAFSKAHLGFRFRQRYVEGLFKLFRRGKLNVPTALGAIELEEDLQRWLEPIMAKPWHTHCQGPPPECQGAGAALSYLARYVVGSAIHNERILSDDGTHVVIRIKNYRTGEDETRRMTGEEFVHRFLLHVLPKRFHRLRYAGLFRSRGRDERLVTCRRLLLVQPDAGQLEGTDDTDDEPPVELLNEKEDQNAPTCPRCAMPGMQSEGRLTAKKAAAYLRDLQSFWERVVTILLVAPYRTPGPRRERGQLEDHGEWLTWTITTLQVNDVSACLGSTPPPDT